MAKEQNRIVGTVALAEISGNAASTNVTIAVEKDTLALIIHPEGMGTWDGPYAPVAPGTPRRQGAAGDLGRHQPGRTLPDIIDLSGALESNRADDEG